MNETEKQTEALTEISEIDEEEILETSAAENAEEGAEISSEIDAKEAVFLTSHPMFSRFARGRQESFDEILAGFREMLAVFPSQSEESAISAKITPAASQTTADVALTERQRAIARAAGMTYLEYYRILHQ